MAIAMPITISMAMTIVNLITISIEMPTLMTK
ncbi:hypothetical protein J2W95_001660 [Flavobacterium granuli]|uniref:Uncharacterized protein n=1 Tax=Flavobacterium granuli TaxID=280093 RepID=A0ABU1S1R2_9FLAO|nr:hypothetical protein [Flavobacterium granuli]